MRSTTPNTYTASVTPSVVTERSVSTHSTRLAELRAKNQQLRATSHQQLEKSKRRLSSHIEVKKPNGSSVENKSCDSPDSLSKQMKHDTDILNEIEEKKRYNESVQKFKDELLSGVSTQQRQLDAWNRKVKQLSSSGSKTSHKDDNNISSEDDENIYNLRRSQQEKFISSVEDLTAAKKQQQQQQLNTSLDASYDMSIPSSLPSKVDVGRGSPGGGSKSPSATSGGQRKLVLYDDSSWSTVEHVDDASQQRQRNTANTLDGHHQEITRLNRKVVDKLRSKVDLLKRSNMKLSEEIEVMRRTDMDKSAMLKNSTKKIHDMEELESSLKRELELCKSRYSVLTMQADKRQKELLKQIDKQKLLSNDRVEVLVGRISTLERLNRRLMTKAQAAAVDKSKMEEAEELIGRLKKKLSAQTVTVDHLMATNDELTSQKRDLEEKLQRVLNENEENSPDTVMAEVAICSARTAFLERQLEYYTEQLAIAKAETLAEKQKRQSCQRTLVVALRKYKGLEDSSDQTVLSEPAL